VESEISSLEKQVERLNKTLDEALKKNRYFIYSTSPFKFIFYNFLAGISRSLGSLVGTLIVLGIGGYLVAQFLSQVDLTQMVSGWVQQVVEQSTKGLVPPRNPPMAP
jgi:hypothetical protein